MLIAIKYTHIACALISISGFALRGIWMLRQSPLLERRLVRILPHVVDTVLLLSAIAMLVIHRWNPLDFSWITAKLIALPVYIVLGGIALKYGRSYRLRTLAFVSAVLVFAYIIAVAVTRNPLPVLA